MANKIPMLRIGEAKDLSALITFLASEKASYMTDLLCKLMVEAQGLFTSL